MKRSLFLALILSLIYPAYANTATEMNRELSSSIQTCEYQKGEDFVIYFKLDHTVAMPDSRYMTAILAAGDESVLGTLTAKSLHGDGFWMCNPSSPTSQSITIDASGSGDFVFAEQNYSELTTQDAKERHNLLFSSNNFAPFIPDDGTLTTKEGWRVSNSTVLMYYNAKTKQATYTIGITHIGSSGAEDRKGSVKLTLTNAELDATNMHFVTDADVLSGKWLSPDGTTSASEYYQTLDDSTKRNWLSGLLFANAPAGSYIAVDSENVITENESGSGILIISPDGNNTIQDGATLTATEEGAAARILAPDGTNTINNGNVVSKLDIIINGLDNEIVNGADLQAGRNIQVDAANTNKIDGSTLGGGLDIIITGEDNKVLNGSDLDAKRHIELTADNTNTVEQSTLTAETGHIAVQGAENSISGSTLHADDLANGSITVTGDTTNTVDKANVAAGLDIIITGQDNKVIDEANLNARRNIQLQADATNTVDNSAATAGLDIIITGEDNKVLNGSDLDAKRHIELNADNTNTVEQSTLTAETGHIAVQGAENSISGSTLHADDLANGSITVTGDTTNTVDKANVAAGLDIIITGQDNKVIDEANLNARRNIQLQADATNTVDKSMLTAGDTITLDGSNMVYGGSKLDADHIIIRDDNDIHDAIIHANKTVTVETGANPGKRTVIGDNTTITAGQIAISGAFPAYQADISGTSTTIVATKGNGKAQTGNVILDNAHVHDLAKPITANGGSIILRNTDTIENATLAIADAATAPGSILAASRSTTNIGDGVNLIGRLASEDTTAALNKLGTDDLLINYDDSAFNGTINMVGANKNQGRLIVTDEFVPAGGSVGVGAEAQINLNGHSMVVSGMASAPMTASLGNLNATGARVEVNYGVVGDQMHLSSLTVGQGGLLCIDVDPVNKMADCLTIEGNLYNDGNPFLYVNHVTDPDKAKLGTRLTVLKVNGDMTGMTKDVISDNGPKDLNMYMEFVGREGQLVYSDNFYSVNGGPNQNAVKEALIEIEGAGTAEPGGALSGVLSSLHHTRSAKDALDALQSLSAAANLLAPHMMMDSTRHHLDTLRRHMSMPAYKANICSGDNKGGVTANGLTPRHEVWAYYSGGHDHLNGDEALDAYNRNYQGGMVGCTRTIGYESRHAVGFAAGFEHASASVTDARMKDNTIYLDLYAITRHKQYTHRFNAGVGIHNFKLNRHTSVLAGAFSRSDQSSASMTATSINLGYELSRDFVYSPYTTYTAFTALDVAIHTLGSLRERGRQDASVNTEYDAPVQVDFAAGLQWSRRVSSFSACVPGRVYAALALHAEFCDRRPTAMNSFQGVSPTTWKTRSQKRDAIYGEFSAGANLPFNQRWAGHIGGDFEFGAERLSIGGYAGVSYTF